MGTISMHAYFPKGYEVYGKYGNLMCMHLHKNLYGMVQASRMFFLLVREWLLNPLPLEQGGCGMVWHQLMADQCVFYTTCEGELCILFFYVDDKTRKCRVITTIRCGARTAFSARRGT